MIEEAELNLRWLLILRFGREATIFRIQGSATLKSLGSLAFARNNHVGPSKPLTINSQKGKLLPSGKGFKSERRGEREKP